MYGKFCMENFKEIYKKLKKKIVEKFKEIYGKF